MKMEDLSKRLVRGLKTVPLCVLFLAITGCVTTTSPKTAGATSAAATSLNQQIETFNSAKRAELGTVPINRRVSRVAYDRLNDTVIGYDTVGEQFLVLHRERDGRFKGTLHVPRETWVSADGPHISPEYLSRCVGEVAGPDGLIFNEYQLRLDHCARPGPGTYFALSPAGGLGWSVGAATFDRSRGFSPRFARKRSRRVATVESRIVR